MARPAVQDHINVAPYNHRVIIRFDGAVLVDTDQALSLKEGPYGAVLYVPRDDTDMSRLEKTAKRTHCPYKGDAHYFTIVGDSQKAENAVWSYADPLPAAQAIAGYLSFYMDQVELSEDQA